MQSTSPMLTAEQLAQRLGVKPTTIRKDAAAGRIPGARKIGRDWTFPEDAQRHVAPRGRPRKETK